MTTVLITDISSYKAVVLCRMLREHYPNTRAITCDTRRLTRLLRTSETSQHHLIEASGVDAPDYPTKLADLCKREGVDVLIPVNSQELGPLLRAGDAFAGCLAYLGSLEDYETLHNKTKLQQLVATKSVRMPVTYDDLAVARLPFVVKPLAGSSSKGVRYAETEEHRRGVIEVLGENPRDHVIQEYIDGVGAGLSGFFVDGRPVVCHAHRRLAEFPISGGSSAYRASIEDKEQEKQLTDAVVEILEDHPWSGFAMFEFKQTPAGDFVFIECNPRVWGSIHQGFANGVNFLEPLLGPAEKPFVRPQPTKRTYFSPVIYLSLAQYAMRGHWHPLCTFVRHVFRNRADVSLARDPLAWLGFLVRLV